MGVLSAPAESIEFGEIVVSAARYAFDVRFQQRSQITQSLQQGGKDDWPARTSGSTLHLPKPRRLRVPCPI